MRRRFEALAGHGFDVLVIGGGIYGAWVACDAARRGLRTALVERDDWAAGTSSASSKLIHGGLRYLEYGRLGLVRKALAERRLLARLAPHRVRPLRFVLPVYRGGRVGPLRLRLGLALYDLLAGGDQPVPGHGRLSPAELARDFSFLEARGLRAAFTFGDCQTDDARLTLEVVAAAQEAGAVAANGAEAVDLLRAGGRVAGAWVEDRVTGRATEVEATVTVNCAGPWMPELSADAPPVRLSKGVHLVLPALPVPDAFLLPAAEGGRVVFLIPWHGRTLVGTTDTPHEGPPAPAAVEPADEAALLGAANRVLAGAPWGAGDIISRFVGLRVLPDTGAATSAITREVRIHDHGDGLITPVGGKLTSARADAAAMVDMVVSRLGRGPRPCATGDRPLPWTPPTDPAWRRQRQARGEELGMDPVTAHGVLDRLGSRVDELHRLLAERPDLARPLVAGAPFCRGEVAHAARHEMPLTLADILRRRLPLLLVAPPSATELADAAALAGEILGWDARRREAEIRAVRQEDGAPHAAHARS